MTGSKETKGQETPGKDIHACPVAMPQNANRSEPYYAGMWNRRE